MAIARPRITEEEFMRLPHDGRKYELVDGEVIAVPAGMRHDEYGARMIFLLYPYTRGRGALCGSQAGFRMADGNIRAPDVSFTRRERLPDGKSPEGFGDAAPDLCIEIVSPSEEMADMERKLREYFAAGAKQVWHMFPESQTVRVFTSPTEFTTCGPQDEIDGGDLLPGFHGRVADLFALE
jgi:Uma2 family endonuclease